MRRRSSGGKFQAETFKKQLGKGEREKGEEREDSGIWASAKRREI